MGTGVCFGHGSNLLFVRVFIAKYLFTETALAADVVKNKQAESSAKEREIDVIVEAAECYQIIKHNTKSTHSCYYPGLL